VEFKKPERNDYYKIGDNPLQQSFEMVEEIRASSFKDHKGKSIAAANDKIPAFCYVICDITETLKKSLAFADAIATPDGQGYYGYSKHYAVYYEVIDYNKLLRDSKKRNRIFFDKLNILGNR
jgi:hypothetical protein